MTQTTTPKHEPETLAARNRRANANGTPDGWLTLKQATDLMLPGAIGLAAGYAERVFLVTVDSPFRSMRLALNWINRSAAAHIADMQEEASRTAAELRATPEQRHRLMMDQAALFDRRLAFLRAFAIATPGTA